LLELVADGFLLAPVNTQTVDKDDVVRLSYRQFLGVRGECEGADDVAFIVFFERTDWEFVAFLSSLVIEMDDAVGSCYGLALAVR